MNSSCIAFFVVLAACVSIGFALECYECSVVDSPIGQLCQDPFGDGVPFKTCKSDEVCLKQGTPEITHGSQTIPSVVIRGCAPKSACDEEPIEFSKNCHFCSSNRCNSEVTLTPSFSTVIVLYIIKLVFQ